MDKIDFKNNCEFVARQKIPQLATFTITFISTLIIALIVYALVMEVDVKTTARGELGYSSKDKVFIEAKTDGVLDRVVVANGAVVRKGQLLAELANPALQSAQAEEKIKLVAIQLKIARLEAERDYKKLEFSKEMRKNYPELVANEMHHYQMDVIAYENELKDLKENYELTKKEVKLMKSLMEKGHIAKFEFESLERRLSSIEADYNGYKKMRTKQNAAEIATAEQLLSAHEKKIERINEQVRNLKIYSPIKGIVSKKSVSTHGDTIKRGDRIVDLVGESAKLIVKLRVNPDNIGFLRTGQVANVKIDSYDFSIYGKLSGRVSSISYTPVIKNANPVYEVDVTPNANYLQHGKKKLILTPGMTVVADILTNKISLLRYLLKPVVKTYTSEPEFSG